MNVSVKIFEPSSVDTDPLFFDRRNPMAMQFVRSIPFTMQWIDANTNGLEFNRDREEILHQCYRKTFQIRGFAEIHNLAKLLRLFEILVFIFDQARLIGSLSKYSFDYLVKIHLKAILEIVTELENQAESHKDITAIIEESRLYCMPLVNSRSIECENDRAHPKVTSKESYKSNIEGQNELIESANADKKSEAKTAPNENPSIVVVSSPSEIFDSETDGPEELEIPVDRVGLISDFFEESNEHLLGFGNGLLGLESQGLNLETVNELFRSIHTVKGGARLLKIGKMEKLAHAMESSLDLVRKEKLKINPLWIDTMIEGKNTLQCMLGEVASRGPIRTKILPLLRVLAEIQNDLSGVTSQSPMRLSIQTLESRSNDNDEKFSMENVTKESVPLQEKSRVGETSPVQKKSPEFIRVNIEKLDEVINYSSELSITRIQFENEFATMSKMIRDWKKTCERIKKNDIDVYHARIQKSNQTIVEEFKNSSIAKLKPDLYKRFLKELYRLEMEMQSEMEMIELSLSEEATLALIALQELRGNILKSLENLNLLSSRLQSGVMNFRMVPISSLFDRFPTLVRDMARQCGKTVAMKITGGDTELDRSIINNLADPLIHVLRNSIDHGIEEPIIREQLGKDSSGRIHLKAYYQGSFAVVEISDDGKGMDKEKILSKALEQGIISAPDIGSLSNNDILNFIFHPGFSTKDSVTEMSGRGVGMDVVKSAINSLQGEIAVESEPGMGTRIYLRLPLTLAIVRVLLFEVASHIFAFPMANISEILTTQKTNLENIGDKLLFRWNGEFTPVVKLSSILGIPGNVTIDSEIQVIILEEGGRRIAIIVDQLFGRQEIVIKNLGAVLKKVPFIMGCTILSDRRIVLVLNPKEILDESLAVSEKPQIHLMEALQKSRKSILVVDDSGIHRQQLKTILNREGYQVDEAENGFEALKMVRIKHYSILCVDIVMPLMDGFELTKRLRNLPLYRTIPIFLITSSTSREDRDRGLKMGANEFFEKPIEALPILDKVREYLKGETKE